MLQWIKNNKVLSTIVIAGLAVAGTVAYVVTREEELPEQLQELIEEITSENA